MGNGVVAHNPSNFSSGSPSFRQSIRGESIVPDWLFQLAAEERIFVSGDGIEATASDGLAALDDTTPSYILRAPSGGTVVQPLYAEFELVTEGGAAPDIDIAYVPESVALTAGTTIVAYNCRGGLNRRASKAVHQLNPTVGAITATTHAMVGSARGIPDNTLSAGLAATVDHGVGFTDMAKLLWIPKAPYLLEDGAMIAVYLYTGTSDSKWRTHWVWAEFESEKVFLD